MMKMPKLELYIISAALILGLLAIGLFWLINRGEPVNYPLKQVSPADTANMASTRKPLESDAIPMEPMIGEQRTVINQGLANLTELKTVKALVLGDAVAESRGASDADEASWHSIISKDLQDKYPGEFEWLFKGTTEATINDVLGYVPEVTLETDLVILCLGRNDWRTVRLTEFKKKYEQLIIELKAKSPQVDIFLIVEPPIKDTAANNRFFPFRKIIMDLGQKHDLPVIDQWSAFIEDPTPLDGLLADGVNPNNKGYRVFADAMLKEFKAQLLAVEAKRAAPESSGL